MKNYSESMYPMQQLDLRRSKYKETTKEIPKYMKNKRKDNDVPCVDIPLVDVKKRIVSG